MVYKSSEEERSESISKDFQAPGGPILAENLNPQGKTNSATPYVGTRNLECNASNQDLKVFANCLTGYVEKEGYNSRTS